MKEDAVSIENSRIDAISRRLDQHIRDCRIFWGGVAVSLIGYLGAKALGWI